MGKLPQESFHKKLTAHSLEISSAVQTSDHASLHGLQIMLQPVFQCRLRIGKADLYHHLSTAVTVRVSDLPQKVVKALLSGKLPVNLYIPDIHK